MHRLPIRECAWCGRQFAPVRVDQRFDCRECLDKYFVEERKRALAAWMEGPATWLSFFNSNTRKSLGRGREQPTH